MKVRFGRAPIVSGVNGAVVVAHQRDRHGRTRPGTQESDRDWNVQIVDDSMRRVVLKLYAQLESVLAGYRRKAVMRAIS